MLRELVLNSFLAILFLLPFGSYALVEENKKTNTPCKGLSKEQRFPALGFQLGMCKREVEEILQKKKIPLKNRTKGNGPDNLNLYSAAYTSTTPPLEEALMQFIPVSTSFLFRNDVLYLVSVAFFYKDSSSSKRAFDILDSILIEKYGEGTYAKEYRSTGKTFPYSKIWVTKKNTIILGINSETPEVLDVSYADDELLGLASKEEKDYRLKKFGEGF